MDGVLADSEGSPAVPLELLRSMYGAMLTIRIFEERVAQLLEANEIRCPTHLCIGQEAVAVGVCATLNRHDYVFGNHRSHGHYLAKGGDIQSLMAELHGKVTGCSRGRGGSMHLFSGDVGILGTVPMVAATIPIAVGAALSAAMTGSNRVAVAFFGDGATEEGVLHESLNFASLKKLPVVFVCENNFFSSHLPLRDRRPQDNLYQLALPYCMPTTRVDGNDTTAVYVVAREAVQRARRGDGPSFIECTTYRWRGHVGASWDLDTGIRDRDELARWMDRCPIKTLERELVARGAMRTTECVDLRGRIVEEVEQAVTFARQSPYPRNEDLGTHVFVGGE